MANPPALAEICWTYTDEAPMLATYSLLPIVEAFAQSCGIRVTEKDISVAGRVLASFPDQLPSEHRVPDELKNLSELAKTPAANIIKLPNISASIPQLKECIAELRAKGLAVPEFPENPRNPEEHAVRERYAKVLGSAVNPVLREGNSDRRAAEPVKNYAKKYPHKMGPWSNRSKTHVVSMPDGDFFGSEKSIVVQAACVARIEHIAADGTISVLKEKLPLKQGEVLDASFMSARRLDEFYARELDDAKAQDVLFSLHLKATMMKVSDPIIFGHCVRVFFRDLFEKHGPILQEIGVDVNNGFGDVLNKIAKLPDEKRREIDATIDTCYALRPRLAMVDSDRGITNLHVPSDIIIDASMPAMIRGMDGVGGGMWCPDSKPGAKDSHLCDTKAVIPDRSYACVFSEVIEHCKRHGAFNPATMGSVPNVGLMAQKAEEYGSHDKTFEVSRIGRVRVVTSDRTVLLEHEVEAGDIWRACQTKDAAIRDWVKLAVSRARLTGWPTVFWLDAQRPHDRNLITKVEGYLKEHSTAGLDLRVLAPAQACRLSLERAREGLNTISVTGNVLRDYNTDLFPILELGTSAKMLSIVPLLAGGGLYETGAGGSAPKHVQQFVREGHLRWDSLGEFLALAVSLEDLGERMGNSKVKALAAALNQANERFLEANKNPSRKVREIDNRGSHFYLALFWAEALACSVDAELKAQFGPIAARLRGAEAEISQELLSCQGSPVDIGGYYRPDATKAAAAMRPSRTFNTIIADLADRRVQSRL